MSVTLNTKHLSGFVREEEFDYIWPQVETAHRQLTQRNGAGSDFLGWVDLPVDYDKAEFARIKKAAEKIRADSDVLIVIGIGGSYLGARAAIEGMTSPLYNESAGTKIYFCGNSISSSYLQTVLALCRGAREAVGLRQDQ